jgi:hypothetical protein
MFKLKKTFLGFILLVISTDIDAQNISLNNIGSLTNILNESSGITFIAPNRLYTHDDSSGNDEIYEIDTLGNLIRTININNANNADWEDITKDNLNNIYIGDFGNNSNDRTDLKIYKIPNPATFSGSATTAEVIEFNYPDQSMFPPAPIKRNYDVEGFVWYNDSLFLFTKNRTAPFNGYCKMYKIPATPGTYTAQICDSIFLCSNSQSDCWVTSAALSPDQSHLALLNNGKIWWFSCFDGSSFFKGAMAAITLNSFTQKEGITFKNNHQVYITDEFTAVDNSGGNLYEADVSSYLTMPFVNIIPDSIICDNCTLTVDSFIGTLSWSNGSFDSTITPNYTGWYKVVAKSLNNCTSVDSVYISYLQSINEYKLDQHKLHIAESSKSLITGTLQNFSNQKYTIKLTDLSGKTITTKSILITQNNEQFSIPVQINNGLYFLNVNSTEENKTFKILVSE